MGENTSVEYRRDGHSHNVNFEKLAALVLNKAVNQGVFTGLALPKAMKLQG